LGKAHFCHLPEVRVHITNKVFYFVFIGELGEISYQIPLKTVWKYIQNFFLFGVNNDAVVLLTAGISFEFVQRNHLRKLCELLVEECEIAHSSNTGNIVTAANFFRRNHLFESVDYLANQPTGNPVVPGQEGVFLEETLTAVAAITALTKVQKGISGQGNIFDNLHPVVVNPFCRIPTLRTDMAHSG